DVGDDRATRAGDADLHLAVDDLLAHAEHVFERALARPRQADVGLVDAEVFHQVEDLELVFDRRIANRRVLQTIPQRLVEEGDVLRDEASPPVDLVPVVDEVAGPVGVGHGGSAHAFSIAPAYSAGGFSPSVGPYIFSAIAKTIASSVWWASRICAMSP